MNTDDESGLPKKLWAPWRMAYMKSAAESAGEGGGCIFCDLPKVTQKGARKVDEDREVLILYRGKKVFVMLNKFPYSSLSIQKLKIFYLFIIKKASLLSKTEKIFVRHSQKTI